MGMLSEAWQRLRALWTRHEFDARLEDEMAFHLEQQAERLRRDGATPDEARRQAVLMFGGRQAVREQVHEEGRPARLEQGMRELRFAARSLQRAPGFVAVTVASLALGIGATTAMFSVVHGVLLRPLPYPEHERLVEIVHDVPALGSGQLAGSPAVYFGYRDHARVFDAVGHWDWDDSPVTVSGDGEPESVASLEVTHEVLPMLVASVGAGRFFTARDDRPGAPPTAIVSHAFARQRFGDAPAVGRTLVVDGTAREVVGVLPAGFRFFEYDAHVYYPLQHVRADASFPSGDGRALARLKPETSIAQANADLLRVVPLLWQEFGAAAQAPTLEVRPALRTLKDRIVGDLGETLWIVMGTIALLLLIACANVANLMLVRTQARLPELVVRSALGASRAAIARVVVAEAALLGVLGGLVGVALAYLCLPTIVHLGGDDLPQIMQVRIDRVVLLVAGATALLATVVAAAVPLAQLAVGRVQHAETLRGARAVGDGGAGLRTRQALVVMQVATALVLVLGAALMIRTFTELRRVEPGFRGPEHVQTFQLTIPATGPLGGDDGLVHWQRLLNTTREILERLAAVPGVTHVGFASGNDGLPLDGDGRQVSFVPYIDGVRAADGVPRLWEAQHVSPGLFETLQTRLVAGRGVTWDDVTTQRPVMLVSANLARREWGSPAAALGRRVSGAPADAGLEIVGVTEDVQHDGLHRPAPYTVVYPPRVSDTATFVVRSARAGRADFLLDLRRAIWSVNAQLAMARPHTLGELYARALSRTSMTLWLLAVTGALAMLLGVVGVYGVVSYAVSRRRREIGIRLALGARPRDVSGMFMRHALMLVGLGVSIGLGASMGLTRLIASQLFGISPMDLPTHIAVAMGLLAAALLASYVAASRGAALAPNEVLKAD